MLGNTQDRLISITCPCLSHVTVWVSLHPVRLFQSVLGTLVLDHCPSFDLSLVSDPTVFPSIRTNGLAFWFVVHVFSGNNTNTCTGNVAASMRERTLILKMSSFLTAIPTLSIHLLRPRVFLRKTHGCLPVRTPSWNCLL